MDHYGTKRDSDTCTNGRRVAYSSPDSLSPETSRDNPYIQGNPRPSGSSCEHLFQTPLGPHVEQVVLDMYISRTRCSRNVHFHTSSCTRHVQAMYMFSRLVQTTYNYAHLPYMVVLGLSSHTHPVTSAVNRGSRLDGYRPSGHFRFPE